uniref:Uncharacterized protein n=1 Tax=Culex tarsalis TaxID=7177 RepID=A0A1Q3FM84_CULTA
MVSIMDIDPTRQICDNRSTLSQSAVSQKSIDLEIPIPLKSPSSTTSPTSPLSTPRGTLLSPAATTDTELAKRAMKLDLTEAQATGSCSHSAAVTTADSVASGSGISSAASTATTTHSSTSNSAATTTTAIIMKHRKLKERTFSEELGSPKSPAASIEVVDDRKALRDALYQGIFHRHRRTIFAVGSFLRMLKSRNSSYNTIRSSSEGEDDTR